jgi:hypothetical protein
MTLIIPLLSTQDNQAIAIPSHIPPNIPALSEILAIP